MILVDTSVWIDHLRQKDARLIQLLNEGRVFTHPFVTGELALGSFRNRDTVLNALQNMAQAPVTTDGEVLRFIERNALHGLCIGYVDAHLLASARLAPVARLWTRDKRLLATSIRLGLADGMNVATH